MTRKDYIAIAKVIYDSQAFERAIGKNHATAYSIADGLSVILKRDNPNFDRGKFMTACGF